LDQLVEFRLPFNRRFGRSWTEGWVEEVGDTRYATDGRQSLADGVIDEASA
jgi:hypothetical protein